MILTIFSLHVNFRPFAPGLTIYVNYVRTGCVHHWGFPIRSPEYVQPLFHVISSIQYDQAQYKIMGTTIASERIL